jgi:hypothetical protein
MVRVLRNLKINEVSTVDRGAGNGCRIVLFKRDDTVAPDNGNNGNGDDEVYAAALHYLMSTPHGASVVRRIFPSGPKNGTADIEHLARLVANVTRVRANNSDDAEPSDPHQPWLDVIGDNDESADTIGDDEIEDEEIDDDEIEKVFHMSDRNTALQALVKRDGGVVPLCKRICKEGARGVTENELTALITEYAQQIYPDMSPEGAFTKIYTSPGGEPLRRAVQIAKGLMDIEPVHVGVADASDTDDAAKAYEQLQRLAIQQRKRAPFLSASQAFERAGRDRPDLLNRATSSPYQLPRR